MSCEQLDQALAEAAYYRNRLEQTVAAIEQALDGNAQAMLGTLAATVKTVRRHLNATDAGKGWVSPEEAKALRDKVDEQSDHIVNMAMQLDKLRAALDACKEISTFEKT